MDVSNHEKEMQLKVPTHLEKGLSIINLLVGIMIYKVTTIDGRGFIYKFKKSKCLRRKIKIRKSK